MIHLSDAAEKQIGKLCTDTFDVGIRLEVVSGGCSGYQYKFTKVVSSDEEKEGDIVLGSNSHSAQLYVDGISAEKITGATIDFKSDLMSQEFVVNNPNSACCGCGKSFT